MLSDPGPSSSRLLDTTSEFLQVLTAPYYPPPDSPSPSLDYAPTETTSESASSQQAPSPLDQLVYEPHGRWAWTRGLSIDDPKQLLTLRRGAQCTASINSGTIADKEIKYICREWKTSKQREWCSFHSELALYDADQYLRPLQGDVVPHVIGVHVTPDVVTFTMEMPHASFWIESSPSMPDALKEKVIAAFEKIHARGVLHGDPELRHMLINADGKVMIIDFGMSRAIREHPSLGIERAEPEEFRLEMRKVKYKLDYMGAREREKDKVDDYARRVWKNRKISELLERRAKGERVGYIPECEEEPEEYELDPPVYAQDFQEDWIKASDDIPMRVVVPGQTSEQVANQVQALASKLDESCSTSSESPSCSPDRHCNPNRHQKNVKEYPTKDENRSYPVHTARRLKRRQTKHVVDPGSPSDRYEDDLSPLSARQMEGASKRRDYVRHRHVRNACVSLSSHPRGTMPYPSSVDVPRSLKPEECRRIQEPSRQATLQYSRPPRGILKRRREDDADEANRQAPPPCKRLRFCEPQPFRGRVASDLSGQRTRAVVRSRAHKRPSTIRPELVDFTLPSLRTLSTLVGSLMPWVHCQG